MPRRPARPHVCEDCGGPATPKRNHAKPTLCIDCGVRRTLEANRQIRAKEGPIYEKWLAAMDRVPKAP